MFKKITSSFVAVIFFLATTVFMPGVGKAWARHPSNNGTPIILIQDVHLNVEAQKNIGRRLFRLHKAHPRLRIGVEAAYGRFDFAPYRQFPDKKVTKNIADHLLKNDRIAGVSWLGLVAQEPLPTVVGVDDAELYHQNVQALRAAMAAKPFLIEKIKTLFGRLEEEHRRVLSPTSAGLFESLVGYHKGQVTLHDHTMTLSRHVSLESYPTLEAFQALIRQEKEINLKVVERERRKAVALAAQLNPSALNAMTSQMLNHNRTIGVEKAAFRFTGDLLRLLKAEGQDRGAYTHLEAYFSYLKSANNLLPERLFSEAREITRNAIQNVDNSIEKDFLSGLHRLFFVDKLARFELTPEEWEEYRSEFRVPSAKPDLMKHGTWNMELETFEAFYELAERRNEAMVENLLAHRTSHLTVLIAGGFHTHGLARLLEKRGLSYVIVTPRFSLANAGSGTAYLNEFIRKKTPVGKFFQSQRLSLALSNRLLGAPEEFDPDETQLAKEDLPGLYAQAIAKLDIAKSAKLKIFFALVIVPMLVAARGWSWLAFVAFVAVVVLAAKSEMSQLIVDPLGGARIEMPSKSKVARELGEFKDRLARLELKHQISILLTWARVRDDQHPYYNYHLADDRSVAVKKGLKTELAIAWYCREEIYRIFKTLDPSSNLSKIKIEQMISDYQTAPIYKQIFHNIVSSAEREMYIRVPLDEALRLMGAQGNDPHIYGEAADPAVFETAMRPITNMGDQSYLSLPLRIPGGLLEYRTMASNRGGLPYAPWATPSLPPPPPGISYEDLRKNDQLGAIDPRPYFDTDFFFDEVINNPAEQERLTKDEFQKLYKAFAALEEFQGAYWKRPIKKRILRTNVPYGLPGKAIKAIREFKEEYGKAQTIEQQLELLIMHLDLSGWDLPLKIAGVKEVTSPSFLTKEKKLIPYRAFDGTEYFGKEDSLGGLVGFKKTDGPPLDMPSVYRRRDSREAWIRGSETRYVAWAVGQYCRKEMYELLHREPNPDRQNAIRSLAQNITAQKFPQCNLVVQDVLQAKREVFVVKVSLADLGSISRLHAFYTAASLDGAMVVPNFQQDWSSVPNFIAHQEGKIQIIRPLFNENESAGELARKAEEIKHPLVWHPDMGDAWADEENHVWLKLNFWVPSLLLEEVTKGFATWKMPAPTPWAWLSADPQFDYHDGSVNLEAERDSGRLVELSVHDLRWGVTLEGARRSDEITPDEFEVIKRDLAIIDNHIEKAPRIILPPHLTRADLVSNQINYQNKRYAALSTEDQRIKFLLHSIAQYPSELNLHDTNDRSIALNNDRKRWSRAHSINAAILLFELLNEDPREKKRLAARVQEMANEICPKAERLIKEVIAAYWEEWIIQVRLTQLEAMKDGRLYFEAGSFPLQPVGPYHGEENAPYRNIIERRADGLHVGLMLRMPSFLYETSRLDHVSGTMFSIAPMGDEKLSLAQPLPKEETLWAGHLWIADKKGELTGLDLNRWLNRQATHNQLLLALEQKRIRDAKTGYSWKHSITLDEFERIRRALGPLLTNVVHPKETLEETIVEEPTDSASKRNGLYLNGGPARLGVSWSPNWLRKVGKIKGKFWGLALFLLLLMPGIARPDITAPAINDSNSTIFIDLGRQFAQPQLAQLTELRPSLRADGIVREINQICNDKIDEESQPFMDGFMANLRRREASS